MGYFLISESLTSLAASYGDAGVLAGRVVTGLGPGKTARRDTQHARHDTGTDAADYVQHELRLILDSVEIIPGIDELRLGQDAAGQRRIAAPPPQGMPDQVRQAPFQFDAKSLLASPSPFRTRTASSANMLLVQVCNVNLLKLCDATIPVYNVFSNHYWHGLPT